MSVYFLEDTVTGFVKIGYSGNVKARVGSLQTATAHPLKLLHTMEGGLADETRIHRELKKYRVHGEWFEGEAAKDYIDQINERYSVPFMNQIFGLEDTSWTFVADFREATFFRADLGAMWRIEGTTYGNQDNSNPDVHLYALTSTGFCLPDPDAALKLAVDVQLIEEQWWFSVNSISQFKCSLRRDSDNSLWAIFHKENAKPLFVDCDPRCAWSGWQPVADLRSEECRSSGCPPYALWRIDGQSASDSSGGDATVYAITEGDTIKPEPGMAIDISTDGRHTFYEIQSIELIDESRFRGMIYKGNNV